MHKSLIFVLLWISSVLSSASSSSDSGGSDGSNTALDGSYSFTSLNSPFQINVCTNSDGETYMSMNVVNTEDCKESNYILGVYRDLNGPQEIGDDILALIMEGFQRELPSGTGFDEMIYNIECDTDSNECILSRNNGAETFQLEKISDNPTVNCYEPGGKFEDISFPAYYKTADISGCSVCAGKSPCFEEQSVNDEHLTDGCWAFVEGSETPGSAFAGGPMRSVELVWEGQLSLENYEDSSVVEGGVGASGSQFTILDGQNIVFSWRNVEGTQGLVYTLDQINLVTGITDPGCPLFIEDS